mmetsp:Transcript_49041/g.136294  ORF Transcript_49041/g.136294 Transcript_49041/m.136294 type:complete len:293 (-) Transcript_49041:732-1610(-)
MVFAAASSFANAAIARCCKVSAALSGCTARDRRRNMRRIAAGPSVKSEVETPSVAKTFVAREIRSSSRSRSSVTTDRHSAPALCPESWAWALPAMRAPPADSMRKHSSALEAVCSRPPTTACTAQGTTAAATKRLAPASCFCATAGGPHSMQRVPPRVPSTKRVPTTSATAKLQPENRAGDSNRRASKASTASERTSANSKSSHSVARALRRGNNRVCKRRAQNSAAVLVPRSASQSTTSEAGLSRKSSGCFKRKPVLWSSGSSTAMSNFLPAGDGRLALATRTDRACSNGS